MGPKFRFLFFVVFLFSVYLLEAPVCLLAKTAKGDTKISNTQKQKDAEAFAQRMQGLSRSLEHLPDPPKLDQTVQIPVLDFKALGKSDSKMDGKQNNLKGK